MTAPWPRRGRAVAADAVIGVTLFGDEDELEFGVFDRAFMTLFQITCGATWVTNLPVHAQAGARARTDVVSDRAAWVSNPPVCRPASPLTRRRDPAGIGP